MDDVRKSVLEALRLMAKRNDVIQDTHGNVSGIEGQRFMWIKPSGVPYDQIEFDSVCGVDFFDGKEVGKLKPSVDTPHHQSIYINNPQIRAICHTHSPHVVAFAIRRQSIPCTMTEQADYFGGDIECFPYSDLDSWGMNLGKLGDRKAVILGNHGGLTFGKTPVEAVKLAIQLENVARKNVLAGVFDIVQRWHPLEPEEVKRWFERYNNVYGQ